MDFGALKIVASFNYRDFTIAVVPMPNWDCYSSKNKMRSIARNA